MAISDIQEKCHLKFHSKIIESLNDRSFADVLIRVEDKELFCHAAHLAAHSEYFKMALDKVWINKREDGLAELDLSQFEKETVEAVLAFIYSGKIKFKGDGDISKIAEASDYLLMPDLFELCVAGIGEFSSEVIPMFAMLIKLRKTRLAVECLSIFPPDWAERSSIATFDEEMIKFVILSTPKAPGAEKWKILLNWSEARCGEELNSRWPLLHTVISIRSNPIGS
jgi:hypothetical protein